MSSEIKVIKPIGILDGIRGNQLRKDVGEAVDAGATIVLIDLEEVTFMDSSGLSSLVAAQRIVRTSQGKLYLCTINEQVKMVFELTRMDRVFETFANINDFKAAMGA